MEIVLNEFRDRFLLFFKSLGDRFSDLFSLENRLENEGIFCDVTDPELGIGWGESTTDLSPLKTQKHSLIAE